MSARAWVIAIEEYPQMQGTLAAKLPDTHDAAVKFIHWLRTRKGVAPTDIIFNTDGATLPGRTRGATRAELIQSLLDVAQWADQTSELYVFFSGHGFFYSDTGGRLTADVLVAHEFQAAATSGGACLRLDELQVELRLAMGPGEHFYFLDACRNEIKSDDVDPVNLGVRLRRSNLGSPSVFTLYSTQRGATASVKNGFSPALVSGLNGEQRAKAWKGQQLVVAFWSLREHLKKKIGDANVDSSTFGPGDGTILPIAPIPQHKCRISVANADPGDTFQLTVSNARGQVIGTPSFSGSTFELADVPDEYYLAATHSAASVLALDVPPVDLYEDCEFRFDKKAIPAAPPPPPPPPPAPSPGPESAPDVAPDFPAPTAAAPSPPVAFAPAPNVTPGVLEVVGTDLGELDVRSLQDGEVKASGAHLKGPLPPGRYYVTLRDASGTTVRSRSVTLKPGENVTVDLGKRNETGLHREILKHLPPFAITPSTVDFSESIGRMPHDDLGVWLSVLGASRIVDDPQDFSKLKSLPLPDLHGVGPNQSAFYVLVGLEEAAGVTLRLGLKGTSVKAAPVQGMNGLFAGTFPCAPGPQVLTVRSPGSTPVTLVSHALPNRASLVILWMDETTGLSLHHYLLPIGSLLGSLDPNVRHRLPDRPLDSVRFMALAQRRFSRGRRLEPATGPDRQYWDMLLYEKWVDPVMAVCASYELMRRGLFSNALSVVNNLRNYFPGLPDTEAIAKLAGLPHQMPQSPPLVLEGVLAFEDRSFLPLPENRLDFNSPWTMWRTAPKELP